MTDCPRCTRPCHDTSICEHCRHQLERDLADLGSLWTDLDTVRTRQTRYSTGTGGSRPTERPLPIDPRFTTGGKGTRLLADTRNSLTTWTRAIHELVPTETLPPDRIPAICAWLMTRTQRIAASAFGDAVADDISRLTERLIRMVDRPADTWYAGICSAPVELDGQAGTCSVDLYATATQGVITCPACKTRHDIADRRATLLASAEQVLATASEIAHAVAAWADDSPGAATLAQRIRTWAGRGRLERLGWVREFGHDRPTYRLGDVLDLLADETRAATRRTA